MLLAGAVQCFPVKVLVAGSNPGASVSLPRSGGPLVVESNGGPSYNSDAWRAFLKKWGIRHRLSSTYYPKSNS